MYQFINVKVIHHGYATLYYANGLYCVDVYLSDGRAPIHSEKFPYISTAKAWRENNAQSYTR